MMVPAITPIIGFIKIGSLTELIGTWYTLSKKDICSVIKKNVVACNSMNKWQEYFVMLSCILFVMLLLMNITGHQCRYNIDGTYVTKSKYFKMKENSTNHGVEFSGFGLPICRY